MTFFRAAMVLAMFAGLTLMAKARDNGQFAQSDLHGWFSAQKNRAGAVCCDEADGGPIQDWERTATGFRVTINGTAFDVPPEAVVDGRNRYGAALVWTYPLGDKNAPVTGVRCFMPGFEG